ncbi:hypothetical protein AYX22_14935 [Arthrobacter sp. D5-1]|nr:hypothetical protein AYX22_14935 [Arthrobacter sp. D5-1]
MTETKASILIPTAAALIGALIGGGFTACSANIAADSQRDMQQTQFQQEQSRLLREKRAPYYAAYDAAVNGFATKMQTRYECETVKAPTCRYSLEDVQSARYELQGAINDIHVYGSQSMRDAVERIANTMPTALTGLTGYVQVGPVDAERFRDELTRVRSAICFDVSPDVSGCPAPSS